MTRYELRLLRRHPLRWARHWWLHWTWAVVLWANAGVLTGQAAAFAPIAQLWPLLIAGGGALCAASAVGHDNHRLQAFTGATIVAIGGLRAVTYLEVLTTQDLDAVQAVLVTSLLLHWILIGSIGIVWPRITHGAAAAVAADAGKDDRCG